MDSREILDQIARLGLFGKRYRDFESAPPEAQRVIRLLAESNPALPVTEPETGQAPASFGIDRAQRLDARLKKMEASIARLERGIAKIAEGLERFEQLDVIRSATRLHIDRVTKIRAGLTRAQRLGKRLGRPRREVPQDEVLKLRRAGLSIRQIASRVGISHTTVHKAIQEAGRTECGNDGRPN